MTYEELEILIKNDEHRQLELKKTTGELKDGMHSACAFLYTEGGWLIFGWLLVIHWVNPQPSLRTASAG